MLHATPSVPGHGWHHLPLGAECTGPAGAEPAPASPASVEMLAFSRVSQKSSHPESSSPLLPCQACELAAASAHSLPNPKGSTGAVAGLPPWP